MGSHDFPGLTGAQVDALIAAYAAPLVHTHAASEIVSGTLDNARVNWASPSAIGSGTPSAITGTVITSTGIVRLPTASGTTGIGIRASDGSNDIVNFQGLNIGGTSFAFFTVNRYYTGSGWASTGFLSTRPGTSLQLESGIFSLYSFAGSSDVPVRTFRVSQTGAAAHIATDTGTAALAQGLVLQHDLSSGSGAQGHGFEILFTGRSGSGSSQRDMAYINSRIETATDSAMVNDLIIGALYNPSGVPVKRVGFTVRGGASGVLTSVNGATPVARAAHIADPSGGATIDAEARTAINAMLVVMENFGLQLTS